jgi:biotin operon repressor
MATPTQDLLNALPPPGGCKSVAELAEEIGIGRRQVARSFEILQRHGLAETPRRGCYRLTRTGEMARGSGVKIKSGPRGPHTRRRRVVGGTLRSRLWRALRHLRKATIPELLTIAGASGKAPENNAQRYLGCLRRAGYVQKLRRREAGTAPTSPGFAIYLLVNDTGPLAPVWSTKNDSLFDPNLKSSWESEKFTGGSDGAS